MDAVHNSRHERSDTKGQHRRHQTLLAGQHYDKHWHGRNRIKNTKLSDEEKTSEAACHLCGATDSQLHAFRSCQHNKIAAIRDQTYSALHDLAIHYQQEAKGKMDTLDGERFVLLTGVLHELRTCTDVARAWTGN